MIDMLKVYQSQEDILVKIYFVDFLIACLCVCVCACTLMLIQMNGAQNRVSDLLELE